MFVGREREIARIEEALSAMASGRGALFAVVGEAGIGKSRLCDEVARRAAARGIRVHWGRSWETGGAPAYWPWIQILESAAKRPDAPSVPDAIAPLVRRSEIAASGEFTTGDPAQERFALFDGVASYLGHCAEMAPIVLIFDDAHTADEPSLDLACFVANAARAAPIVVIATARAGEARSPSVAAALGRLMKEGVSIALGRLSESHVVEMCRSTVDDCPAHWPTEVFRLTEGNPLFVREMVQALVARPAGVEPSALAAMPVLDGAAAMIRPRLERLEADAHRIVELAAAIGREISADLLESASNMVDLETPLRALLDSGLLIEAGSNRYLFSHLLVREALYRGMGPDRRRTLHASLAQVLAQRIAGGDASASGTRAHHLLLAMPLADPDEVARGCLVAAEHARGQLAHEEAVQWLERARDEARPNEGVLAEVHLALGWALADAGRHREQLAAFEQAAIIARRRQDVRLLARAALGYGGYYLLGEVRGPLVLLLREALAALPADEIELRARLEGRLAAALTPAAVPEEPLALARAAVRRAASSTNARTRIDVAVSAGSAFTGFVPPQENIALSDDLVRTARAVSDRALELRGLWRLVSDHLAQGDVARADASLLEVETLSRSLKLPRYAWQTPVLRSMRLMIDGRFADCEACIEEARAIGEAIDDRNVLRCLAMHAFHVALLADDAAALPGREAEAIAAAGDMSGAAQVQDVIASAAASRLDDRDRANAALDRLVAGRFHYVMASSFLSTVADAAVLVDHAIAAPDVHALLSPCADQNAVFGLFALTCGTPCSSSLGALEAQLGRVTEAHAHFDHALARARAMRARAHEVWVRFQYGRALTRQLGDAARGCDELRRAAELAETLEMSHFVERVGALLGDANAPEASRDGGSFSLTQDGARWEVRHHGRTFFVPDRRGMAMLARLVEHAGRELHVSQLVARDPAEVAQGDAGEILDERARTAYQRRLEDLRDALDEAERFGDRGRETRVREEIETLEAELARAVGLGGRARRAGSSTERARITVQRRVREAIGRIAGEDAELGRHLDFSVRTGTFCIYDPNARRR